MNLSHQKILLIVLAINALFLLGLFLFWD